MQKFFCDNCGTQVRKNETRCPECGRYFKSVRCPECGLTGRPELFSNGCPDCGYAQEKLRAEIDYFDIETTRKKGKSSRFSDRFYKRVLPVLIILFIFLLFLLFRSGW